VAVDVQKAEWGNSGYWVLLGAEFGLPAGFSGIDTISDHGVASAIVIGRCIIVVMVDLLMISISCCY